jgi:hypothetical protein
MEDGRLYNIAEDIVVWATGMRMMFQKRKLPVGLIQRWKDANPDVDITGLEAKHFNHREDVNEIWYGEPDKPADYAQAMKRIKEQRERERK